MKLVCCAQCGEWMGEYARPDEIIPRQVCEPCSTFDEDIEHEDDDHYSGCCNDPCVHLNLFRSEDDLEAGEPFDDLYPYENSGSHAYFSYNGRYLLSEAGTVECCNCGTELTVVVDG